MIVPNLLVTDDDRAMRETLCEGLARRGFQVTEASDGLEAIQVIKQCPVHVCLVDFHMPRLNGLEVIRRVHRISGSTPCLLMSADLNDQIRSEALAVPVYDILAKPLRLSQLSSRIFKALADVYGWPAN